MDAIASEEYKNRFTEFFNLSYAPQINDMFVAYPKKRSVIIDIRELQKYDLELTNLLLDTPDDLLGIANNAINELNPNPNTKEPVYARFSGVEAENLLIQDVGSQNIGKLTTLDALVVKRSEIIPKVRIGVYKCSFCGTVTKLFIDKEEIPEVCMQCKRKSLKHASNESEFVNMQRIAVQDPLEKLKGSTPTWQLEAWLEDDLVNTVLPGDRIELTGILRIRPRKNSRGKEEKSLFTMFFDTVSMLPKQKEFAEIDIPPEVEEKIKELAKTENIFEKIAISIAPSIYGHGEIKKALALQLFGGTPDKTLIDGAKVRSDIHMLLIGDPGSAKTRLLQAVTSMVPKGIYVSGKSTSGAGLTATAERDEFSEGGWTLKAGALVLGSGGEVSIDEFDKIGNDDKNALLEALESQTISVAKAGIVARFNARTSVLAAANPKYGRFDPNAYPAEQFDIPPPLLSRFDLIFPIKDILDEEQDKRIARHILMQHEAAGAKLAEISGVEQVKEPPLETDFLRKYVAYAKKHVRPRLSQEASERIQTYYIGMRKMGMKQGAVPITPRQIEGLVRLAEASAKSRLAELILLSDADLAIGLFEYMLKTLAVDSSGRTDIDALLTGMPKEKVAKLNIIKELIKKLETEEEQAKVVRVLEEAEKRGVDRGTTTKYINEMERNGDIYSPRPGIVKIVKQEAE